MGQATRTTKLVLDLGKRTQGGANTSKQAYLEATVGVLSAARAFYVAFFLAHLEQWALVARTGKTTMTLTDSGSGLVTSRKSLQKLVALVQEYQVAEVVVTFSDRLTRFGLSYLTALFSGYGVTLTVLHPDEDTTPEEELTQDLLALIASFAGRLYGLRSRKQKALVDCAKRVLAEAAEES